MQEHNYTNQYNKIKLNETKIKLKKYKRGADDDRKRETVGSS